MFKAAILTAILTTPMLSWGGPLKVKENFLDHTSYVEVKCGAQDTVRGVGGAPIFLEVCAYPGNPGRFVLVVDGTGSSDGYGFVILRSGGSLLMSVDGVRMTLSTPDQLEQIAQYDITAAQLSALAQAKEVRFMVLGEPVAKSGTLTAQTQSYIRTLLTTLTPNWKIEGKKIIATPQGDK